MNGSGSATGEASVETGERIEAKQRQRVSDRVGIQPRLALEHERDLPEQVSSVSLCLLLGAWVGDRASQTRAVRHAPIVALRTRIVNG